VKDLTDIPYSSKLKLALFDIAKMYTNIPTNELLTIIDMTCQNNYGDEKMKQNIIKLSKTITDQNYFQLQDLMYTGCPRRNVPDFGRVFLMLKYTDITQNTYVQS